MNLSNENESMCTCLSSMPCQMIDDDEGSMFKEDDVEDEQQQQVHHSTESLEEPNEAIRIRPLFKQ